MLSLVRRARDCLTGRRRRELFGPGGNLPPDAYDFAVSVPLAGPLLDSNHLRLAVVCHCYYVDFLDQLMAALQNVPGEPHVYLSTDTAEKASHIRARVAHLPQRIEVAVVPNRGRDIAPKLIAFASVYSRYDYILFLHSKKSVYNSNLANWGAFLVHHLAGSKAICESILALFEARADVGMVGVQHFGPVRGWCIWGRNLSTCVKLAERMGVQIGGGSVLDFPSGSMFWTRPAALKALIDLSLTWEDFAEEMGQIDETLAHAIERLFYVSCEVAGYSWLKVYDVSQSADEHRRPKFRGKMLTLDDFIKVRSQRLLTIDGRPNAIPRRGQKRERRPLTPWRYGPYVSKVRLR